VNKSDQCQAQRSSGSAERDAQFDSYIRCFLTLPPYARLRAFEHLDAFCCVVNMGAKKAPMLFLQTPADWN
jgi:hypothetical protein